MVVVVVFVVVVVVVVMGDTKEFYNECPLVWYGIAAVFVVVVGVGAWGIVK